MSISTKDVAHIAKLARLGLSELEKKKYSKDLSGILDYMKKLNMADTKDVRPTSQVAGQVNIFRKDENPHGINAEKIKKIIGQAPHLQTSEGPAPGHFVKTKPILEK